MTTKQIVILGSGFGGMHAYRKLYHLLSGRDGVEVTILSDTDYFWFTPMAHEVATGNLTPGSLKQSLRYLPQDERFGFRLGRVEKIDADKQTVYYSTGEIEYDYLIVALGADTDYHNIEGAAEYTIPLRSLDEVRKVKNTILSRFEEAQEATREQDVHDLLNFVVVGGGPTGVELAGELVDMKKGALARAYPELARYMSVSIFQGASRLVPHESEWMSEKIQAILEKKGVGVKTDHKVRKVEDRGVWSDQHFTPTQTVIWTAGVRALDIPIDAQKEIKRSEKHGRIYVKETLQIPAYPEMFVIGDQSYVMRKDSKQPYPMRAQFAVRQGKCAAGNIISAIIGAQMEAFDWNDRGLLISLGKGSAVARVLGVDVTGPFAWFIYRTAYLPQILGWRAKLRIMFEWTLNLFLSRDLSQI